MTPFFQTHMTLTHHAVMHMLEAAIAKATEIGRSQCIVIVDGSGELLGEIRMTGSRFLSRRSAATKARTAASIGAPSDTIPEEARAAMAAATGGAVTGLPGGLAIIKDGILLGGIGVGSGNGEQDIAVAAAALESIGADIPDHI